MTHQEKIIVSAYTGVLMCDFSDVHKYIEEKMGRPVWTHEMADPKIQSEIYNATREDFLALCKDGAETPPYVAEIESEYEKWVSMPHINKPLAKALYEVWKKHDREDVSRNG